MNKQLIINTKRIVSFLSLVVVVNPLTPEESKVKSRIKIINVNTFRLFKETYTRTTKNSNK